MREGRERKGHTIAARQPNSTHGGRHRLVSNRWLGSQRSVPNFSALEMAILILFPFPSSAPNPNQLSPFSILCSAYLPAIAFFPFSPGRFSSASSQTQIAATTTFLNNQLVACHAEVENPHERRKWSSSHFF